MSASRSFDLARLQLRHPDAFFCSLSYGRYKYLNQTTDLYLYLRIGILIMITGFAACAFRCRFILILSLQNIRRSVLVPLS